MTDKTQQQGASRIIWSVSLIAAFAVASLGFLYFHFIYPQTARHYGFELPFDHAMFGPPLEQPIAFSHRLHVTDKEIDCFYCHPFPERSMNSGLPSVQKCLGCHDHIIPTHKEITKLKSYRTSHEDLPWVRVYYNPDHVFFPHNRHLAQDLKCGECHGSVETVDRLHQVTFYMGFCLACHRRMDAPTDCLACHQ
jgi:Cytochrome c7 and related cytochrome c